MREEGQLLLSSTFPEKRKRFTENERESRDVFLRLTASEVRVRASVAPNAKLTAPQIRSGKGLKSNSFTPYKAAGTKDKLPAEFRRLESNG